MNLKPLGDRVVVKPSEQEEQTASGIFLPETAKEKPQQGTIVAVGPGVRNESGERVALAAEEGHTVVDAKDAGTTIKLDGDEYLILKESDVLAIVVG